RRDMDISTLAAAFRLRRSGERIDSVSIAMGGVGPTVLRLSRCEAFLHGQVFAPEILAEAGKIARDEITPISDVRGGAAYRWQVAENLFQKWFHDVEAS
ncbi:MAG: xanthine dehydrogenase, partial [Planctomycetota bacterium]